MATSRIKITFGNKKHKLDLREVSVQHLMIAINSLKGEVEQKTGMDFEDAEMISRAIASKDEDQPKLDESDMDGLVQAILKRMMQNDKPSSS